MKNVFLLIFCLAIIISQTSFIFSGQEYSVTISSKGSKLFKEENTGYYIEVQYCYQYLYYEKATLKYYGYGTTKGKLIFRDGSECDVKEIYRAYDAPYGAKCLSPFNELVDVKLILVPIRL